MATATASRRATAPRAPLRAPRAPRSGLLLLALLALYLVVCAVGQPGPQPVRDEGALLGYAARLLEGGYADTATGAPSRDFLWHGPGLPLLLAPLVALDLPLTVLRLGGPLLLAGAVAVFHRLLRLRLAPRPALLWTGALALYVPFGAYLLEMHKEPLAVLLVVVAMLALARGLGGDGGRRALGVAGLALGALALVRLEYGPILVVVLGLSLLWALVRRRSAVARRLAGVAAVGLLVCVPWLAYTHAVTGQLGYWGNASGLSLFWMSPTSPGETGQWHSERSALADPALRDQRPLFVRLAGLGPLERDRELHRLALDNIRRRPGRYAVNLAANASRLLFLAPMRPRRPLLFVAACVLFNGLLVAGLAWGGGRVGPPRRDLALPPETGPFALLAVLSIGVHLPTSAQPRMLVPAVPLLVWFVVLGWRATPAPSPARPSGRASSP